MTKIHARAAATELRKNGHSYNFIAPKVGVSKSTLSAWLADIPYVPNRETVERIGKARAASGKAKSRIKRESIELARTAARNELGRITKRDVFMLGLGLYVGEGAKSDRSVCFVNSNPWVLNLIIRWLVEALGLSQKNLRLRIHLYPDCNEKESLRYWSRMTSIPLSQFQGTVVDRRTNKKAVESGKLPFGTAHLVVHSLGEKRFGVFLARKILAWSDMVMGSKHAGLV